MKDLNRFCLTGNVGKEPDFSYLPSGNAIVKFSLANNIPEKDGDTYEDKTHWFNLVAFGKLAENLHKLVSKGARLYVECKVKTDKYEKDGQTRYATNFEVREFLVLKFAKNAGDEGGEYGAVEEENIPF